MFFFFLAIGSSASVADSRNDACGSEAASNDVVVSVLFKVLTCESVHTISTVEDLTTIALKSHRNRK